VEAASLRDRLLQERHQVSLVERQFQQTDGGLRNSSAQ